MRLRRRALARISAELVPMEGLRAFSMPEGASRTAGAVCERPAREFAPVAVEVRPTSAKGADRSNRGTSESCGSGDELGQEATGPSTNNKLLDRTRREEDDQEIAHRASGFHTPSNPVYVAMICQYPTSSSHVQMKDVQVS